MSDKKNKRILLIGPVLLIVFNIFIFGPFTIFQGNTDEFQISFTNLILYFIVPAILMFLILFILGSILRNNQRYISILLSLGVLIWFQGNILVWKYGLMDGQGINWNQGVFRGIIDGLIWIIIIILAIIFYKKVLKIAKFLSFSLLTIQLLLLGIQSIQNPDIWKINKQSQLAKLPPDDMYSFSEKQNVILIILDGFQSDIFQEIISENPDYYSTLDGFTFFKETCGAFPTTKMSIPAIFSSRMYKNRMRMSRYISTRINSKTIHRALKRSGFHVDLVCGRIYRGSKHHFDNHYSIAKPYGVSKQTYFFSNSILIFDLSLFRHTPHYIKRLIYNDQTWLFQRLINKEEVSNFHFLASQAFFKEFIDKMVVAKTIPVYKLIHIMHPHPPIVVDSQCKFTGKARPTTREGLIMQAKCGLNQTISFLAKLKSLHIYDSSLIIIQADHGAGSKVMLKNIASPLDKSIKIDKDTLSKIIGSSAPLMLIKRPFSQGHMVTSAAPTMITDIPATICDILNINAQFNGKSMFNIKEDESRTRTFHYHPWKHQNWKKEHFDRLEEYIIEGSLFDLNSWKKGQTFLPVTPNNSKKHNN